MRLPDRAAAKASSDQSRHAMPEGPARAAADEIVGNMKPIKSLHIVLFIAPSPKIRARRPSWMPPDSDGSRLESPDGSIRFASARPGNRGRRSVGRTP